MDGKEQITVSISIYESRKICRNNNSYSSKKLIATYIDIRWCFMELKKQPSRNLATFRDALYQNWRFEGIVKERIDEYFTNGGEITFAPTYNLSILGSINDMISLTECRIEDYLPTEKMNILELNKLNNRTPLLMLEKTYAFKELKAVWG